MGAAAARLLKLFNRELFEKALFFELGNEAHLDKIIRLGRLGGRVRLGDVGENRFYTFTFESS